MAERYLARFLAGESGTLEWLSIGAEPPEIQSGNLQELAAACGNTPVVLLLPATAVVLLEIELPIKNAAQLKKALPFALEDKLADDVENYHLVWLRQPDGRLVVAAIAHEKLAACLADFQEAGIVLEAAYPAFLCLPYYPGDCSLLIEDGQTQFRSGPWQGGGADIQVLPLLLKKMSEEGADFGRLRVFSGELPAEWRSVLPFECIEEASSATLSLFAGQLDGLSGLNLLSGQYAPKRQGEASWRAWLPGLCIVALALSLQFAGQLSLQWRQQAQLQALERQTTDLFKQTFPEVKRVVNVKAQAGQQLSELKKHTSQAGSGFMRLLYQSGDVLKNQPTLQIKKAKFGNDNLLLWLTVSDFAQLDQFTQQLPAALQAKIQSTENSANGMEAQLEIREK